MNRKGIGAVGVVLIVLLGLFVYWLVTTGLDDPQCERDSDCGPGFYCGSDLSCHEFKIIEQTTIEMDLLGPSLVIGLAILAAAVILRNKR
jgi:hypothetical protein